MNTKLHVSVTRAKKFLTSMVVLLIFLFPMVVSARWVYDVMDSGDRRKVYREQDIAAMRGQDCDVDTDNLRPFEEPLVTITFDDGWESVYSNALGSLEAYCMKSTQYILGDHFGDQNYLSAKQVASMQAVGHEIASHTMTHPDLTALPADALTWELSQSGDLLRTKFGAVHEFASPLGAYNDAVITEIKKYYRSHRNTAADPKTVGDEDINVAKTFDRYNIVAYTIRQTTTDEDIRALVAYTIKRKGWLVLNYHQVDDSDAYYAVSKDTLERHLQIIQDNGVRTPVMGQVLDILQARERKRTTR